jgi:hypothetical protein
MKTGSGLLTTVCLTMVFLVVLVGSLLAPSGCATRQEVAAARARAVEQQAEAVKTADAAERSAAAVTVAITQLADSRRALDATARQMAMESEERKRAEAKVAELDVRLTEADAELERLTQLREASTAKAEEIGKTIEKADSEMAAADDPAFGGNALAELIGAVAGVAGVAGLGKLQAKHGELEQGTAAIVKSIDWLATVVPDVYKAFDDNAQTLDLLQGPVGKQIVDKVQGKVPASPLA